MATRKATSKPRCRVSNIGGCPICGNWEARTTRARNGATVLRCPRCRTVAMLNGPDGDRVPAVWAEFLGPEGDGDALGADLGAVVPGTFPEPVTSGATVQASCPFCLAWGADLKPDRRGGRFIQCSSCLTRVFVTRPEYWPTLDRLLAFLGDPRRNATLSRRLMAAAERLDARGAYVAKPEASGRGAL